MSDVRCLISYVRCKILHVRLYMSDFTWQLSNVSSQKLDIRCRMSDVIRQKSRCLLYLYTALLKLHIFAHMLVLGMISE